jgi:tRNA (cytidine/uridine-2'-O-)-methyltransferase
MFHIVLFEPEIPPNTGNIMRLCANAGARLHLIHPLGFLLDDRGLRRAGLDYRDRAIVQEHHSLAEFYRAVQPQRLFACSTKGKVRYSNRAFFKGDAFLFGPETRGLPLDIIQSMEVDHLLRIPMTPSSRSLNLSNAVAIVLYEAWRQLNFSGALD